jgi:adenosylhomocysteine nucleosidase
MTNKTKRLGIISALLEEQHGLLDAMQDKTIVTRGRRQYACGSLWGVEVVCVLSRIGKVAAAATAVTLIENFNVTHLLFTGVAGGASKQQSVGDIVLAEHLVQHDMDSSPLFPRFEIPLTGKSHFTTDEFLSKEVKKAVLGFFEEDFNHVIHPDDRERFNLIAPVLHFGLIASGDQFIADSEQMNKISKDLPNIMAVEMEGAAVAQVCFEFDVPFAVVRTISDSANEASPVDFVAFIEAIASHYAYHIVRRICLAWKA